MVPIQAGSTSQTICVAFDDTTGAAKTDCTVGGFTAYYKREGATAAVAITLAAGALGTWSSGGMTEVSDANMAGVWEFGIPNAALAAGAKWVVITFAHTGALPTRVRIMLTDQATGGRSPQDHTTP